MFCPSANVISPYPDSRSSTALVTDTNGDGRHDVILEKDESGNTFLHLVMPATAVNFLNGSDGSNLFDFANHPTNFTNENGSYNNDFDDVYVELGCKVYEVNKVYYRGGERIKSPADPSNVFNVAV